jgi:antitoxin component YwqK of YwqJK toxin-antitoxin module
MSKEIQPKTVKNYFSNSLSLQSITKYDNGKLLHGEQRSWWDRNHHNPKELSVYRHGSLIRTINWHLNGNIKTNINTYNDKKDIFEYYSCGSLKYHHHYKFSPNGFVKHGEWIGLYRSGVTHYTETYNNGNLVNSSRFYTTGKPITCDDDIKPIISDSVTSEGNVISSDKKETKVIEESSVSKTVSTLRGMFSIFFKKLHG